MPQALPRKGLPDTLLKQLYENEILYFFSPVTARGGCLSSFTNKGNFFAALTDKRFLYHAKVEEGDGFVEREGTINLENISNIETVHVEESAGCMGKDKYWQLRIFAHGAEIRLPFPNKEKGVELRKIYHELTKGSSDI